MPDADEDRLSRKRSKLEAALKELRDRERTRNLKRFAIIGRAVWAQASHDPAYKEDLLRVLDAQLRKSNERELFGLPSGTGRRGRRQQDEAHTEPAPEPAASPEEAGPFMGMTRS